MATVPITHGDTSLPIVFQAEWPSGSNTIVYTVHKAVVSETPAQSGSRVLALLKADFVTYPPG